MFGLFQARQQHDTANDSKEPSIIPLGKSYLVIDDSPWQVDTLVADGITCGQGVFYSPSLEKDAFLNALKGRIKSPENHETPRGHEQVLAMVGRARKLSDERRQRK